ncbi:uncharacterized protein [Diabrotica undecimpunctata]|uniref:uncharacterized protein isoform X1 n=2 Tax=Diabrotica undecimpunctata TaxID=50387 RepID=UPI003B63A8C6
MDSNSNQTPNTWQSSSIKLLSSDQINIRPPGVFMKEQGLTLEENAGEPSKPSKKQKLKEKKLRKKLDELKGLTESLSNEEQSNATLQSTIRMDKSIKKQIEVSNSNKGLAKQFTNNIKNNQIHETAITNKLLDEAIFSFKQKHLLVDAASDLKMIYTGNNMVIPKRILNNQVCGYCLKYLSVGPVTISNKCPFTVCGREKCAAFQKSRYDFRQLSVYNKIAKNYYFHCVNHYEGCTEVFPFSENVENHETLCTFKKIYQCLICFFKGNACQLIQHYKQNHPGNVTSDGVFHLKTSKILFYTDHQLIKIIISVQNDNLKLSFKQLTRYNPVKKYTLILFHPSSDIEYISKVIDVNTKLQTTIINLYQLQQLLSTSVLFGAIKIYCKDEAKESTNFIKPMDDPYIKILKYLVNLFLRSEITCCHCNNTISLKTRLLLCPQSHVTCTDCIDVYCAICENDCFWIDIENLLENFKLPCNWKNCNKQIKCLDFPLHTQICCKREYSCPELGCEFKGNKKQLRDHWHSTTPLLFGSKVIIGMCQSVYWITDYLYEMLFIHFKTVGRDTILEVDEKFACFPTNYTLDLMRKKGNENHYKKFITLAQKGPTKSYSSSLLTDYSYKLVFKLENPGITEDITENNISIQKEKAESVIKRLLNVFMKVNFKCSNCNTIINDKYHIYICDYSHIYCSNCSDYCVRCTSDKVVFTSLEILLENIKLSCDWPDCTEKIDCWNFLSHKQVCLNRLYTFPTLIQGMDHFSGTKEKFQENWPKNGIKLTCGKELNFEIETQAGQMMFWLTSYVNELLVVIIVFDKKLRLEVKETLAIFTNNYKIELCEYNGIKKRYDKIEELKQSGNKKISLQPLKLSTKYRLTIFRMT